MTSAKQFLFYGLTGIAAGLAIGATAAAVYRLTSEPEADEGEGDEGEGAAVQSLTLDVLTGEEFQERRRANAREARAHRRSRAEDIRAAGIVCSRDCATACAYNTLTGAELAERKRRKRAGLPLAPVILSRPDRLDEIIAEVAEVAWTGQGCDVCGFGSVEDVDSFDPRKPCPECSNVAIGVEGFIASYEDAARREAERDAPDVQPFAARLAELAELDEGADVEGAEVVLAYTECCGLVEVAEVAEVDEVAEVAEVAEVQAKASPRRSSTAVRRDRRRGGVDKTTGRG